MRNTERWYVWKEHLFSVSGTPDCELKILGRTTAEHTAEKFGARIVEEFPEYGTGEMVPKSAVESLVRRAEEEGENIFFGAGWALVKEGDLSSARYIPLKAGAAFLSLADYPFVAESIRTEILKKLLRRGVVLESTSGVYIDATAFVESGAVLSHDVTVTGRSLIKSGARILPYTVIEGGCVENFSVVGPFAHIRAGEKV